LIDFAARVDAASLLTYVKQIIVLLQEILRMLNWQISEADAEL
jgi:hypothetical protein